MAGIRSTLSRLIVTAETTHLLCREPLSAPVTLTQRQRGGSSGGHAVAKMAEPKAALDRAFLLSVFGGRHLRWRPLAERVCGGPTGLGFQGAVWGLGGAEFTPEVALWFFLRLSAVSLLIDAAVKSLSASAGHSPSLPSLDGGLWH